MLCYTGDNLLNRCLQIIPYTCSNLLWIRPPKLEHCLLDYNIKRAYHTVIKQSYSNYELLHTNSRNTTSRILDTCLLEYNSVELPVYVIGCHFQHTPADFVMLCITRLDSSLCIFIVVRWSIVITFWLVVYLGYSTVNSWCMHPMHPRRPAYA